MTCSKLDDSAINGNGDATTVRLERKVDAYLANIMQNTLLFRIKDYGTSLLIEGLFFDECEICLPGNTAEP